jgi:hypothetical protein
MKQLNKTQLAALVVPATLGLAASQPGEAVVVVSGDQGWEISFDGSINGFAVYEEGDNRPANVSGGTLSDDPEAFRLRTGLLPALLAFNVKTPVVQDLQGSGRIGFYPQIQNTNQKNQFGSQIDLREVFFTVDSIGANSWGQLLVGRTLSLFLRTNYLTDMTQFGVGVQGGVNSGGITLGRIGYGYVYPNYNPQLRYTTPDIYGLKISAGAFDPSVIGSTVTDGLGNLISVCGTGNFGNLGNVGNLALTNLTAPSPSLSCATKTKFPRFEGEASYATTYDGGTVQGWVNGLYQTARFSTAASAPNEGNTVTAWGIGGGVQGTYGGFGLTGSGYYGEALGTTLLLDTDSLDPVGNPRTNFGWLVQGTYTFAGKTTVGVSGGSSQAEQTRFERDLRAFGGPAQIRFQRSITVGVYHDINAWLKIMAEFTRAKNEWFGGQDQSTNIGAIGTFFVF